MATLEKPKILIVDDLEVNLILLETVLRKEPTEIFKATSGEMALGDCKNDMTLPSLFWMYPCPG